MSDINKNLEEQTEEEKKVDGTIKEVNISSEMKSSFLSYAMSVIVSRALPDVRDGFKPVQRRIVYTMNDLGIRPGTAYKKSARIVGEVMGKYHPHGDSSIYEAMVRMAQDFSYHHPLVEGHGNFGSVDGDGAAAMRYTEARLSKIAMELVKDLDKDTVDFVANYDNTEKEPSVLPVRFPNLLVNGVTGIAVGMATNIPPHNLGEVINGFIAFADNPQISVVELMKHVQGPDFPTGGTVMGLTGLKSAYESGNGTVVMRAKIEVEEQKNKNVYIVTEIPYGVNKTRLIERIADVAKDKVIEGITDLRDESSLKGMRIVIEAKKDIMPQIMINNLYNSTQLQTSFGINMIALVNGKPETVTLTDIYQNYLNFQMEIVQRRTKYLLEKAEARFHILEGLIKALNNIDKAIDNIKKSKTGEEAKLRLIKLLKIDEIQAQAILDMKLQRLTGLEIESINKEAMELRNQIADYNAIIKSDKRKLEIVKEEALAVKKAYAIPRRTEIDMTSDLSIENEDLIPVEDVLITITKNGYIKRMDPDAYKLQNRSGVGVKGVKLYEDDFVDHIEITSTHDFHLFFTNKGKVYRMKGYQIPFGERSSRGLPIVNLLNFEKDERFASLATVKDFEDDNLYLFFVTKDGLVKRTKVSDFKNINKSGIIAIDLKKGDELLNVLVTDGTKDIILGASNSKAIRFPEEEVRVIGRQTSGVSGMRLKGKEHIVGIGMIEKGVEQDVLVVSEKGYGKKTSVNEYKTQHRDGLGIMTLNATTKTGQLAFLAIVEKDQDLIVSTDQGVTIRVAVDQISRFSRSTQGVRVIRLKDKQKVVTAALVPHEEGETEDIPKDDEDIPEAKDLKKQDKKDKKKNES